MLPTRLDSKEGMRTGVIISTPLFWNPDHSPGRVREVACHERPAPHEGPSPPSSGLPLGGWQPIVMIHLL